METRNRIANANPNTLPETVMKSDDLWCMDLPDLPRAVSFKGNSHCLLIVDAFSSYRVSLFSPTKNGLIAQLSRYLMWHTNYTFRHPKFFQMDGAGELKFSEITELMNKYHISPRYSEPYDARANGRAEKSVEMAVKYLRSALHHSGLSFRFWPYAVEYWTQIRNQIPLPSNARDKTDTVGESPFTTYFPDATNYVSNFAIFGAFATIHLTKSRMSDLNKHTKLDLNTLSGVYLGVTAPGRSRKEVVIYVPSLERVVIVRQCNLDATFLPYRRTNRRIKPFEDPGFPETLLLCRDDRASN